MKITTLLKGTFISIFVIPQFAHSYTFLEAVESIRKHESVGALESKSRALKEEGESRGSWGDPMLKIAAKNFPKDSLEDDETPMTGIEFGIAQKISLTTKYGNIEDAFLAFGESKKQESANKVQELIKSLWDILIENKKLGEEIGIIKENISWIKNILKVSKRLYANGKISQQALLDIQIRKSELEALLSNKEYGLKQQLDKLSYVLDFKNKSIVHKSIPWSIFKDKESETTDLKELSLQSRLMAKSKMLTAKKLAYVPDLTFSIGYTKRSNIDNKGDFVSAMVTFPLPLSSQKYSGHSQAVFEKTSAEKQLTNYRKFKRSEQERLIHQIDKLKEELNILKSRTLRFAENSRNITSKSYSLGDSTYIELLQSELKLQSLLLKRAKLDALILKTKAKYKYLIGEKLYE
ncbi:MAG: hypothetical protein CME70_11365 [Halobacteriovorax sp.]|nr:hypothetical protein [Halobacteriovorax sp.]|tara:strand:- start:82517 stop:83737 length:1221 start_codon:yes stop_codon:yes gene_type:complete